MGSLWCRLFSYVLSNKYSVLLFLGLFWAIREDYKIVSISFPHWARIGRLIRNVDKFSQMSENLIFSNQRASNELSFENVIDSPDFAHFANRLKAMSQPPYVLFFDMSNLDVTVNHICNLKYYDGPLKRLVAVSFDEEAEKKLNSIAPFVPTVTVDFTAVKSRIPSDLENKKYVTYQLILLLRARIVAALAEFGIDFWAMQQDSIWTMNFDDLGIEALYPDAHMLFDTVGNDQFHIYNIMKGWICGSTFFVRASPTTAEFFKMVAHMMTRRLSPDSTIMTYLCGADHYKCVKLPKSIVSSSNYFMGDRSFIPAMIQVDHESKLKKIDLFKKNNFYFRKKDGTCDSDSVRNISRSVVEALPEVQQEETPDDTSTWLRWYRAVKEYIGFDPYNHKNFLRVHEGLV